MFSLSVFWYVTAAIFFGLKDKESSYHLYGKIKTLLKFRVYFKMTNHSTKYYHETRVAKQGFLQINSKLTFVEIIILLCPSFVHVNPSFIPILSTITCFHGHKHKVWRTYKLLQLSVTSTRSMRIYNKTIIQIVHYIT